MSGLESKLWTEKYRPKTIEDTILPDNIKSMFTHFKKTGDFPNLLLSGDPGMGKTTIAKALAEELGWPLLEINASSMLTSDFRGTMTDFVTRRSLNSDSPLKIVLLDEADHLTGNIQANLKNFFEAHSHVCRFIMTANLPGKIISPLHSRCTEIVFQWDQDDRKKVMGEYGKKSISVLKKEGVDFDPEAVAEVAKMYFPDFRRILNDLQKYSAINGKIDVGVLATKDANYETLYKALKEKKFPSAREWVSNNKNSGQSIYSHLLNDGIKRVSGPSIPNFVHILGEYSFRHSSVPDPEVNLSAMIVEIIRNVEFK